MKVILRAAGRFIVICIAALAGNWLGGALRYLLTGDKVQSLQFRHTTHSGRTFANTPVASKFYPALIFSKLGRPPVLFAFLGGVLAGGLIPDRVEEYWVELLLEPLFANR